MGWGGVRGAYIQFDQAERQIPAEYFLPLLAHLRWNKTLAQCFSVGKQDFRAGAKINVSLKFIQYRATF